MSSIYAVKNKLLSIISSIDSSLQPQEKHVFANWRLKIWEATTFPIVTIRLTRGNEQKLNYGFRTPTVCGEFILYHLTAHIWALNSTPKAKAAQDLADKIINYFSKNNKYADVKIVDVINMTYRESEPDTLKERLSRIIFEADILVETELFSP